MILKIGTRTSPLALTQTNLVIQEIKKYYPKLEYEVIPITTTADKIKDRNLYDIGGKALFLKELEEALIREEIDIAVHSLKDVPGNLDSAFEIAAVLEREDPREVFISKNYKSIKKLPIGAKVGTSSMRRKAYLLSLRPDLEIVTFRGNIDSRIRKILVDNHVDATLLTAAGLKRLGLFDPSYCHIIEIPFINLIDEVLSQEELGVPKVRSGAYTRYVNTADLEGRRNQFLRENKYIILPAPCQGVIAVEILQDAPDFIRNICIKINHKPTFDLIKIEREFVEYLNASCDTALAAYVRFHEGRIHADFMLVTDNIMQFHSEIIDSTGAVNIGVRAARKLLNSHN